jgi:hypothetical protein
MPHYPATHHEGAKQNTIGVIKGINAKLRGLALTYPMENETPFIHHIIERQGCDYTIENNESLNERPEDIQRQNPNLS